MQLVLVAAAAISIQLLHLSSLAFGKNIDGKIHLRLYRQSSKYYNEVPIEQGNLLFRESEGYNKTLPIILIIHGMAMGADSPFVNGVVDAYVERQMENDYNIFSFDMPELFENSLVNDFYIGVLGNVQPAGRKIGEFLNEVINFGLTIPENINMVGYSMGAQVAGYAARLVKDVFGEINYIVGLDPAGPGFHNLFGRTSSLIHVSRDDAKITHFFHTNSISCGTRDRVGTADFVFNNGGTQPGCFKDASLDCSHIRIPYLYIEAIANPENFIARHCGSWTEFVSCECNHHESLPISFPPNPRAHGIYYLRTHGKSPFGMGKVGARCRRIIHPVSENGYHVEITPAHDPVLSETKNPLKNQKIQGVLLPMHHHIKDEVNMHLINGIKKIEDYHTPPVVTENVEQSVVNEKADKLNEEHKENFQSEEDLQELDTKKNVD